MSVAEALAAIRALAAANRIRMSPHASERARQRGASFRHIRCALMNAASCAANRDHADRWNVSGDDLDGDELTCVVVIEADVIVITVY